jgi:hypothetical protein
MFKTKLIILKVLNGQYKLCINYAERPRVFKPFFWLYHDLFKKNIFLCCDFRKIIYILRNVFAWSATEFVNLFKHLFFDIKLVMRGYVKKSNFYNINVKTKKFIARKQKFLIVQSKVFQKLAFTRVESDSSKSFKKFKFRNFKKKKHKFKNPSKNLLSTTKIFKTFN